MSKHPLTIYKSIPAVSQRMLDVKYTHEKYIWFRAVVPDDLDLNKFPHIWILPHRADWDQVINWCEKHLGPVDGDWTWTHTDSLRFVDESTLHQLNLIF